MPASTPRRSPIESAPAAEAHVVLLGLMGTGKTVVGRELAEHLRLPLTDNDAAIGALTDLNARQIRDRHGTRVLHRLEAEHLLGALASTERTVICAAGSVVDNERCRSALAGPGLFRIWLRARPETLAARFHNQDHRPLFGTEPLALFTGQIATRSQHFVELADAVVDVDGLSIPEVVRRVIAVVAEHGQASATRSRVVELDVDAARRREQEHEA